ncbi:exodeoxyribonuclease VII large subunit [Ferrimicrobium sp.]|uniref:exodeoxyribonuclease VII large subunit n=1 Tax=Ferrimicrobium sp. TaxID=2926050 RepID=UPI00262D7C68|nr:exodeoxyribonuclease VII large subunit [Ferrimicrobium sp.]
MSVSSESVSVFSVANLWEMIEGSLEPLMTTRFRLRGTLQDVSLRRHLYCSLADRAAGATAAKVNAVIFASDLSRIRFELLSRGLGELEGDVEVVAIGRLSTYRPAGRVSFVIEQLDYDEMRRLGRAELERLRAALIEEGIFDANKRRELSAVPLRIGIVTSEAGTVQHDFTRVLVRSGFRFSWRLYPTRVTGTQAADEMAGVIQQADAGGYDLIVLLRGGGAESELALFNTEAVVRSVVNCTTPVWCAIGHAADDVLVNEVAHRALDVPQSVATALVERVERYRLDMTELVERAVEAIAVRLRDEEARSRSMAARVIGSCHVGLTQFRVSQAEQLASLHRLAEGRCRRDVEEIRRSSQGLRSALQLRLAHERPRLLTHAVMVRAVHQHLGAEANGIEELRTMLDLRDPRSQLRQGYAILQDRDGRWLTSAAELLREEWVRAIMADGTVEMKRSEGGVLT